MKKFWPYLVTLIVTPLVFGWIVLSQFASWRGIEAGRAKSTSEIRQAKEDFDKSQRALAEVNSHYVRVVDFNDSWSEHMAPEGLMSVNARMASVGNSFNIDIGNKRSHQAAMDFEEFKLKVYTYQAGVSGSFVNVLSYMGMVEEEFPLSRFRKLEIRAIGDGSSVDFESALLIPDFSKVDFEAPSDHRQRSAGRGSIDSIFRIEQTNNNDEDI